MRGSAHRVGQASSSMLTLIKRCRFVVCRQPRVRRRNEGAFVVALNRFAIDGKVREALVEHAIVARVLPGPNAVLVPLESEGVEILVEILAPE